MRRAMLSLAAGAVCLSACATYGDYGYHDNYYYGGDDYASGGGEDRLDPWLAETDEGRRIVALGFDGARDPGTAQEANIWFRRYADSNDDMRLTDPEIRLALVQASRDHGRW